MILLYALLAGVLAGLLRARLTGKKYNLPDLEHTWIIFFGVFIQALAFAFPITRSRIPDFFAPLFLVVSQAVLLVFVVINRNKPGFFLLGIGLIFNFLVILLNGGMMPISPALATALAPPPSGSAWESGVRFGWSKDIVLEHKETTLWLLSDIFLSPRLFGYRYAFSPGDVLIAFGAFWFAATDQNHLKKVSKKEIPVKLSTGK